MIDDIRTVMWKEWKEIVLQEGGRSNRTAHMRIAIAVLMFGVFIPWRTGPGYVTSWASLLVPSLIPLFAIIGIVTDSFAGERERHTLETLLASRLSDEAILLGKLLSAVVFAFGALIGMLVLGLIGVNVSHWSGHILMFPVHRVLIALAFNLLGALVVASAGVLVSLRAPTVKQAMQTLTVSVMVLLYGSIFLFQFVMPAEWRARVMAYIAGQNLQRTELIAAALLAALSFILFSAARLRFRRARLILD